MNLRIGEIIIKARKEKGMTQEQLAESVGVSPPAVSKWETGSTYPDITLLAPIARALGITIDHLLSFHEELREEDVARLEKDMEKIFQTEGIDTGIRSCEKLLHEYPNCIPLKYRIAILFLRTPAISIDDPDPEKYKELILNRTTELYEQVLKSGDPKLTAAATIGLASIYMTTNKCDQAEKMLDSLPKDVVSPELLYPMLYMFQGKIDKSEQLQEKILFRSIHEVLESLNFLSVIAERKGNLDRALYMADTSHRIARLIDLHDTVYLDCKVRMLAEQGKINEALEYFEAYVNGVIALDFNYSGHPLFSSISNKMTETQARNTKRMFAKVIQEDKRYEALQKEERFQKALEKLRKSV